MTLAYQFYFSLIWTPVLLAAPTAIVLLVWGLTQYDEAARLWVGVGVAAILLMVVIFMFTHGPRLKVRAGAWPAWCRGDHTPTTETELRDAVKAIKSKHNGRLPTIVGSGWGFFLYRKGAPGPRIFTHNFTGRHSVEGETRWKAGTTIVQLTKELLKKGLVLETFPTMDYITLGGWFAPGCHGNGGPASGKSSDCMLDARVLDMTSDTVKTMKYLELRKLFDDPEEAYKHCLIDVQLDASSLRKNTDVQKKGILINSSDSVAGQKAALEWLDPLAYLRVIFMGAARPDYAIGLIWTPVPPDEEENSHRDPHFCSRYCQYTQVDNCSVVCGWHEPMSAYNGITSRYHANQWMPGILPLESLAILCAGYRNFEIFFKIEGGLTDASLYKLVTECIDMHQRIGGRTELRNGQTNGIICLDCSLRGNFDQPFRLLYNNFKVRQVALHLGKWHDLPTYPCVKVPVSALY